MTWQDIPGQSHGGDIERFYSFLAKGLPHRGRFVEVGVLFGRGVAHLGTLRPDLELWAVDAWKVEQVGAHEAYRAHYGCVWAAFQFGMREHAPDVMARLGVLRADSTEVQVRNCDAVFLDADHDYEGIRDDIKHWWPLVKKGGILAGHDFCCEGVQRAVLEVLAMVTIGVDVADYASGSTVWWVVKT